jgi:hypothetical protein
MSIENVLTLENGKLIARSDLNIYGELTVNKITTHELVAHTRYDAGYFEFSNGTTNGTNEGSGFLWPRGDYNRQLIWRNDPSRFWFTDSLDLAADRAYHINGSQILSETTLGGSVVDSNLQKVGHLKSLSVLGNVNFNDTVFFNATAGRLSVGSDITTGIFTVYDQVNDVEFVITGDTNQRAKIGTVQTRSLDLITDNQARLSVEVNGDVTVGHELDRTPTTRVYGKVSVNVKSPTEDLEVAGNIKFANRLFAVGSGMPTSGSYTQGDTIWNSNPKTNDYVGWICIQGGTPGEWKPFGLINS